MDKISGLEASPRFLAWPTQEMADGNWES
jgi:hypothetical protein